MRIAACQAGRLDLGGAQTNLLGLAGLGDQMQACKALRSLR